MIIFMSVGDHSFANKIIRTSYEKNVLTKY